MVKRPDWVMPSLFLLRKPWPQEVPVRVVTATSRGGSKDCTAAAYRLWCSSFGSQKDDCVVVCSVDDEVALLSQCALADVSVLASLPVDHFA